jgi:hypothetical protein
VPAGTKLPRLRCFSADVASRACDVADTLSEDGQIGVYVSGPFGDFVGYAIKEDGDTRFEPATTDTDSAQ